MLKFQLFLYSAEEDFKYRLKEDITFNITYNLGSWKLIDPKTKETVAICSNNQIVVKSGYMWDGSTVIGEYYEDYQTMEASLLHDVLYNAKKNPDNLEVSFSLFKADALFRDHLVTLYTINNENFWKRKIFPWCYYFGLISLGIPWKFGNNKYYHLICEGGQ
jgi:hypothetical protein